MKKPKYVVLVDDIHFSMEMVKDLQKALGDGYYFIFLNRLEEIIKFVEVLE